MVMEHTTLKIIEKRLSSILREYSNMFNMTSVIEHPTHQELVIYLVDEPKDDDKIMVLGELSNVINNLLIHLMPEYRVVNEYYHKEDNKRIHLIINNDKNRMEWHGFRKRS